MTLYIKMQLLFHANKFGSSNIIHAVEFELNFDTSEAAVSVQSFDRWTESRRPGVFNRLIPDHPTPPKRSNVITFHMNTTLKIYSGWRWDTVQGRFTEQNQQKKYTWGGRKGACDRKWTQVSPRSKLFFRPTSAQTSDVIFGAALAAALAGHAQRKVPLLLAGCGTIGWD